VDLAPCSRDGAPPLALLWTLPRWRFRIYKLFAFQDSTSLDLAVGWWANPRNIVPLSALVGFTSCTLSHAKPGRAGKALSRPAFSLAGTAT